MAIGRMKRNELCPSITLAFYMKVILVHKKERKNKTEFIMCLRVKEQRLENGEIKISRICRAEYQTVQR